MVLTITIADFDNDLHRKAIPFLINAYAQDQMGGGRSIDQEILDAIVPGLQAHGRAMTFLAFDGEHPVGIANCFFGFSTFAAKLLLNIHDLSVLPERRGEGISLQLLQAAEAEARRRDCCKVTLEVRQDNYRARKVYERFGFGNFSTGTEQTPTFFLEKVLSSC